VVTDNAILELLRVKSLQQKIIIDVYIVYLYIRSIYVYFSVIRFIPFIYFTGKYYILIAGCTEQKTNRNDYCIYVCLTMVANAWRLKLNGVNGEILIVAT